jgi:glyoxylase-like metal-dependent hydrolase (beta-lactamase superfamily II)
VNTDARALRDVFFLTCGVFVAPGLAVLPLGRRAFSTVKLSNTVAVAVRPDGDLVLVDAGWSTETCARPARSLGRLRALGLGLRVREEDAIVEQLRRLGFEARRVRAIFATHLHLDHAGGVDDFPNAEVVVSQAELRAYWDSSSPAYRARDLARAGRIRAVALDETPSYGFPGSADPLGDGRVVMLDASGHTPGSVAVAIRGPRGTFVHVGDAVYQRWEYGGSPKGPGLLGAALAWSGSDVARTLDCIRACEADPRHPTIVSSHDADVFNSLPHAPSPTLSS